MMLITRTQLSSLPDHGSPADRGSADAYYGREYSPHHYPFRSGHIMGARVSVRGMTDSEITEYTDAFENEIDRKVW